MKEEYCKKCRYYQGSIRNDEYYVEYSEEFSYCKHVITEGFPIQYIGDCKEFKPYYLEYKINDYLKVVLKHTITKILVNDKEFMHCKYLLANIPIDSVEEYDEIGSIDDLKELIDHGKESTGRAFDLEPETEFWGHCSNLQTWFENDYDLRLLHSNLSFPLLKELYNAGDPKAKRVFKEEIALRLESNSETVILSLLEQDALSVFEERELKTISKNIPNKQISWVIRHFVPLKKYGFFRDYSKKKGFFNLIKVEIKVNYNSPAYSKYTKDYYHAIKGIWRKKQLPKKNNSNVINISKNISKFIKIQSFNREYYMFSMKRTDQLILIDINWFNMVYELLDKKDDCYIWLYSYPKRTLIFSRKKNLIFHIKTFKLRLDLLIKDVIPLKFKKLKNYDRQTKLGDFNGKH